MEDQQRIFEPFQCASNAAGMKGLGLGLSIVLTVLKQIGCTILLTSKVGEGTSVRVEIPIGTRGDQPELRPNYSILIIEDDSLLSKNMELILQMEGFAVRSAPSGDAGLGKKGDCFFCGRSSQHIYKFKPLSSEMSGIIFIDYGW